MNDEKLKKVSVVFKFTATSGASQTADYKSGRPDAKVPATPEETLAEAIDELCRVATIARMDPVKIAKEAATRTKAALKELKAKKKSGVKP